MGTISHVRPDGKAELVGECIGGHAVGDVETLVTSGEFDCVLDEVQNVSGASAVGFGECAFSGDGRVDIEVHTARVFTGAGVVRSNMTDLGIFEGLNAGTYDESGDFELITITKANATHVSGTTYYSTRLETFTTDFAVGETHVEECSVFIDYKWLGVDIHQQHLIALRGSARDGP